MRPQVIRGALRVAPILATLAFAGCADAKPGDASAPVEREREAPSKERNSTPADDAPTPTMPSAPPAPEGAITLPNPDLFVQTCGDAHPCPQLVQAEGEKHCASLTLGAASTWRLPTREEVERLRGVEGLGELAGYHWTSTAFEQDDTQVWIVDPTADQPTTVPRDRKPFRIRCVREP